MTGDIRILIIGSFCDGAIEKLYRRGLERCHVQVEGYAAADQYHEIIGRSIVNRVINKLSPAVFYKGINEKLLSFLSGKKYDIILVFKGMELFEDTVKQLKGHATLVANYNCDHPFRFFSPGAGNQNVLDGIKHYDVHFSYSKKITEQLATKFGKQAYCIPFGYDQDAVAVAGNTAAYQGRFLFIGAFDSDRAKWLNELNAEDLDIYGNSKWKTRNGFRPQVAKSYRQRSLYGNDYSTAIVSSLGIINLLRDQNIVEQSHNMRTFEVPGYGGLLMSQRTGEQAEYFEEDKEAVFFDSMDELRDKMAYLRKNIAVVEKIKMAGYERSRQSGYSYDERSRQLLTRLKAHL
jgi:spore maturation protein CgeB